jgi:hypothetical protein
VLACLLTIQPAHALDGWPYCSDADICVPKYLNVGDAAGQRSAVDRPKLFWWLGTCLGCSGRAPHAATVDERRLAVGRGMFCVALHPDVDQVRVTSQGGHCGEPGLPELVSASRPGPDIILRSSVSLQATPFSLGCQRHDRTGDEKEVAYGGVALNFADGYGFGDSYAAGLFYGVYDGFGLGRVRPFQATVAAISEFNTYHYRVEVLADGRADWTWPVRDDNR